MEFDDLPAEAAPAGRRVSRRQLVQSAITLAMQSQWQEAVEANQRLVEMMPGDAEAYNRLGKAHTELGQVAEARQAYEKALQADPANLIAQRNLDRLSRISETEAAEMSRRAGRKLDPQFFMEETGKTGITQLSNGVPAETLATLTAGEQVMLEEADGQLRVLTVDGVELGTVEEGLGTRLLRLMSTGNQYQAGVVGVDGEAVRIIIRETHRSPQNAGRISFPPRTESLPRPYLREGLIRRTGSGDEEEEDDLDIDLQDEALDEEDEESGEFGFHEDEG